MAGNKLQQKLAEAMFNVRDMLHISNKIMMADQPCFNKINAIEFQQWPMFEIDMSNHKCNSIRFIWYVFLYHTGLLQ